MTGWLVRLALIAALVGIGGTSAAAKAFRLAAAPELVEGGFLKYLLPRFSLKTGVRIEVVEIAATEADAVLARLEAPPEGAEAAPVLRAVAGGAPYSLAIRPTPARPHVLRFRDWLGSEIGKRTISRFEVAGAPAFAAVEATAAVTVVKAPAGDVALGERLSLRLCGRCHVVNASNRYAGIGSTPSFGALRSLPRWRERFAAFWTLNPHPAFTQVEGVTGPFDPTRPPPIAPLKLTPDQVEAILAFVSQMAPKDLGAPLQLQ